MGVPSRLTTEDTDGGGLLGFLMLGGTLGLGVVGYYVAPPLVLVAGVAWCLVWTAWLTLTLPAAEQVLTVSEPWSDEVTIDGERLESIAGWGRAQNTWWVGWERDGEVREALVTPAVLDQLRRLPPKSQLESTVDGVVGTLRSDRKGFGRMEVTAGALGGSFLAWAAGTLGVLVGSWDLGGTLWFGLGLGTAMLVCLVVGLALLDRMGRGARQHLVVRGRQLVVDGRASVLQEAPKRPLVDAAGGLLYLRTDQGTVRLVGHGPSLDHLYAELQRIEPAGDAAGVPTGLVQMRASEAREGP